MGRHPTPGRHEAILAAVRSLQDRGIYPTFGLIAREIGLSGATGAIQEAVRRLRRSGQLVVYLDHDNRNGRLSIPADLRKRIAAVRAAKARRNALGLIPKLTPAELDAVLPP